MISRKPILIIPILPALLLFACAHSAPQELVAARSAYEQAEAGPAKEYTPAELHVAKKSLMRAEQLFEDKGDNSVVRDQAYIAMRKAELAAILARTEVLRREVTAATRQTRQDQVQAAAETRGELESTQQELVTERERREAAEKQAAQAAAELTRLAADLARLAAVKEDERGTVITLSGSVLFASGKSALLPAARNRLGQVAEALLRGEPEATFVVEGHTDARGTLALNQRLSLARANAVRDYLVERGVPSARITAEGHGPDRPIADNDTAEGRANNRRVEIVVKPGPSS